MMPPEQLAEIEKRADAATDGPWHRVGPPWNRHLPFVIAGNADPHVGRFVCDLDQDLADEPEEPGNEVADAEFIAHARTDVPALVAEVKQLTAERDEARAGELAAARNEPGHALPEDRDHAIVAYFRLFLQWRHQRERADKAEAERDGASMATRELRAERDADRADVVKLCQERLRLIAERDEARAGWTKAVEIATEASNQRDQALAALETAVDALRSGT